MGRLLLCDMQWEDPACAVRYVLCAECRGAGLDMGCWLICVFCSCWSCMYATTCRCAVRLDCEANIICVGWQLPCVYLLGATLMPLLLHRECLGMLLPVAQ